MKKKHFKITMDVIEDCLSESLDKVRSDKKKISPSNIKL